MLGLSLGLSPKFEPSLLQRATSILRSYGTNAHLYLPGAQIPVLGPNLVTNGDFSGGATGWNPGAGWSISSGVATCTASTININQGIVFVVGKSYRVTLSLTVTSGSFRAEAGMSFGPTATSSGVYSAVLTPAGGDLGSLFLYGVTTFTGSIDNITVQEILGYTNHVNGITAGNWLDSAGTTAATVDNPVGLVIDAAGYSLGVNTASTAGWTTNNSTIASNGSELTVTATVAAIPYANYAMSCVVGTRYLISVTVTARSTPEGNQFRVGTTVGGNETGGVVLGVGSATLEFVATQTTHHLNIGYGETAIGQYSTWKLNVVASGIHASQNTPASKPILRKGPLNQVNYSQDITQWATTAAGTITGGQADPYGGTSAQLFSGATKNVYFTGANSGSVIAGVPVTHAIHCYSASSGTVLIGSANGTAQQTITINPGWGMYAFSWTSSFNDGPVLQLSGSLTSLTVYRQGFFKGAYTAQQILDAGGIPLTTTAPASSIYGIQSWQFDGADDYLSLGSVPFQMADDHCVVAGAKTNNAGNLTIFEVGTGSGTNPRVCSMRVNNLSLNILWSDGTSLNQVFTGNAVSDVPFVLSGRKTAAGVAARKNGVPGTLGTTPMINTTSTAAFIGNRDSFTGEWMVGHIYPVIAIKGTVSDADLLTLEKFVGSLSGVTI